MMKLTNGGGIAEEQAEESQISAAAEERVETKGRQRNNSMAIAKRNESKLMSDDALQTQDTPEKIILAEKNLSVPTSSKKPRKSKAQPVASGQEIKEEIKESIKGMEQR